MDLVIALYKNNGIEKLGWDLGRFVGTALLFDTNCYVVLRKAGIIDDEVLRIDLFRQILPNKKDWHELVFIGGLFHVLKHFSYRGKNLSTGNEIQHTDADSLEEVVLKCVHAFVHKIKEETSNDFIFDEELTTGKVLRYVFYKEEVTDTFYIKTVHMK